MASDFPQRTPSLMTGPIGTEDSRAGALVDAATAATGLRHPIVTTSARQSAEVVFMRRNVARNRYPRHAALKAPFELP